MLFCTSIKFRLVFNIKVRGKIKIKMFDLQTQVQLKNIF